MSNKPFQICTCTNASGIETITWNGGEYYKMFAVLLVEGVHHGVGGGPLFYPKETLEAFAEYWAGKPAVLYHPPDEDGIPTSANTPEYIDGKGLGFVFEPYYEDAKLKANVYLEKVKTDKLFPDFNIRVSRGNTVELSTAGNMGIDFTKGEWNNEEYDGIVTGIFPDHLAILPDQTGACSVADGCGIPRQNRAGGKEVIQLSIYNEEKGGEMKGSKEPNFFLTNSSLSHSDLHRVLSALVREGYDEKKQFGIWISDVYDDYFVYSEELKDGKTKYFKQSYAISDQDEVTISDKPKEVIKKVDYVEKGKKVKPKRTKNVGGESVKKDELIKAIIENEKIPFTENCKPTLEKMSEEQLGHILNQGKEEVKEPDKKEEPREKVAEVNNNAPVTAKDVQDIVTVALSSFKPQPMDTKAIIEVIKAQNEAGEKEAIVAAMTANTACPLTKEDLEPMSLSALKKLQGQYGGNYGLRAVGNSRMIDNMEDREPLEMPGYEIPKQEKGGDK